MSTQEAHIRIPQIWWDDEVFAEADLASVGLWLQCAMWSADRLTDGVVPLKRVRRFGASDAVIEQAIADGLFEVDDQDSEQLRVHRLLETTRSSEEILGKRKERKERQSAVNRENASRGWAKRRAKAAAATTASAMRLDAERCDSMRLDAEACEACLPVPTPVPKNAPLVDPGIPRDAGEVLEAKKNHDPSELDRPPTFPELPWPAEAITTAEMMLADPDGRPAPSDGFLTPEDLLAGQWARWVAEQTSRSRDGPKIPLTKAGWTARFVNDLAHIPRRTS